MKRESLTVRSTILLFWNQLLVLFVLFNLAYALCLKKNNFGLIDIFWGLGPIVAVALASFSLKDLGPWNHCLCLLILLWGLRLTIYLSFRNLGHAEDKRYRQMRESWGSQANRVAYFKIFILQCLLSFFLSLTPTLILMKGRAPEGTISWISGLALIVSLFGLIYESLADYQLMTFKKNPENQGKRLNSGVWGLSRHPNYFGEITFWWGIYLFSFDNGSWPYAWVGAGMIHFLILKISGVPLLEKTMKEKTGNDDSLPAVMPRFWR